MTKSEIVDHRCFELAREARAALKREGIADPSIEQVIERAQAYA